MKYIIMCGGPRVLKQATPNPLRTIKGEILVERIIRLLRECGVEDIAISSEDDRLEGFGVPVLHHTNYRVKGMKKYHWVNCFYPVNEPVCYIMGDVYFSPQAIKTIVETETDYIEFFASAPPFGPHYLKRFAEPFAFKVQNVKKFFSCVNKAKQLENKGTFTARGCIAWEFWQVVKNTPYNQIDYTNYVAINDYTVDLHDDTEQAELERELALCNT